MKHGAYEMKVRKNLQQALNWVKENSKFEIGSKTVGRFGNIGQMSESKEISGKKILISFMNSFDFLL